MSSQNPKNNNQLDALQARMLEIECELKAISIRKMRTKQDIGLIKKKFNKLQANIDHLKDIAQIVSLSEYRSIMKEIRRLAQGLQDLEVFYGYDDEKSKLKEAERKSIVEQMARIVAECSRVCKVLVFPNGRPKNTI